MTRASQFGVGRRMRAGVSKATLAAVLLCAALPVQANEGGRMRAITDLDADARRLIQVLSIASETIGDGVRNDAPIDMPLGSRAYAGVGTIAFREILGERHRASAVEALALRMAAAGLATVIVHEGAEVATWAPPWPPHERMREVPVAVIGVAAAIANVSFRGAEWKSIVHDDAGNGYAVTTRHDLDGALDVDWATWSGPIEVPDVRALDLRATFGIGAPEAGTATWSERELGLLALALERLNRSELEAVKGLVFRRHQTSPEELDDKAGLYRIEAGRRWIEVYDLAFADESVAFAGSLRDPVPTAVRVVLHELGHAIALAREADIIAGFRSRAAEFEALTVRFNQLGRRVTPREAREMRRVRQGLDTARDQLDRLQRRVREATGRSEVLGRYQRETSGVGPTEYGTTTVAEAFAEAFALYRVDRAALRRAQPSAVPFFDANRHTDPRTLHPSTGSESMEVAQ